MDREAMGLQRVGHDWTELNYIVRSLRQKHSLYLNIYILLSSWTNELMSMHTHTHTHTLQTQVQWWAPALCTQPCRSACVRWFEPKQLLSSVLPSVLSADIGTSSRLSILFLPSPHSPSHGHCSIATWHPWARGGLTLAVVLAAFHTQHGRRRMKMDPPENLKFICQGRIADQEWWEDAQYKLTSARKWKWWAFRALCRGGGHWLSTLHPSFKPPPTLQGDYHYLCFTGKAWAREVNWPKMIQLESGSIWIQTQDLQTLF